MKRLLLLTLVIGLISCSNIKPNSNQKEVCSKDTAIISKCKELLPNASEFDKKFIMQLMKTIENFCDKKIDTTIISLCQLDSDNKLDTIETRVYENLDKIIAYSSWSKNGKLLWEKQVDDPYMWINDNPLFNSDKRSKWITFTIGIYHTAPNIYKIEEYNNLRNGAIGLGVDELQKNGFKVERETYKQYIENYKGNLIDWGHPESRDGLYIWYEPLQKFVSFYHE